MKKYFLTVVYAIDDKPETVEAILAQRPWQAVVHTDALADLEHAQADLTATVEGYDAARLEIKSLQARIQELGQMARECSDRKVVQLESALAAHVRSGKDWAMRVEALERTITTLRAQITTLNAQVAAAEKAMRELEAQVAAVGAGGVEPLRKRECLHQIQEPDHFRGATKMVQADARDATWLTTEGRAHGFRVMQDIPGAVITHSTDSLSAAIAAAKGE